MQTPQELTSALTAEIHKIVIGKDAQIHLMIAALFAEGHILLDDMPGVGKTALVRTMSIALGCQFRRIQFTPDLLPSDVTGMNIYDRQSGAFKRMQGPVVTNILLADEINRAIPRTQSALLEAMEERQITIDGETDRLPTPFIVMATQNPVEFESTFRLPAAQMDRFFLRLSLGYPEQAEEAEMLRGVGAAIPFDKVQPITDAAEIAALQKQVQCVHVSDEITAYIVSLSRATRVHPLVRLGVSPRGSRSLFRGAKAMAAMAGRDYVVPEDVQALSEPVLAHRLTLTSEARLSGKDESAVIAEILQSVPVPPTHEELFHAARQA
ncbi:MAG: MoxR family ATPase [Oscillospiraceae bacterium]|nr:MoxR family ATPase [Oscillospiraceae bacterium]